MRKIKLDERFITESVRIRESYLKSILELKNKEKHILEIKTNISEAYDLATKSINEIDSEMIEMKIENLTSDIQKLQTDIEPILDNINILKGEADYLFEKIKEKFPKITKQELIESVYKDIIKIDNKYDLFQ